MKPSQRSNPVQAAQAAPLKGIRPLLSAAFMQTYTFKKTHMEKNNAQLILDPPHLFSLCSLSLDVEKS